MSSDPHYGGNLQNEILRETHDHTNSAQRVNVVAGGVGQATVNVIGSPTVMVGTPTLYAVVNTSASSAGNTTLNPSPNFIGLTTTTLGNSAAFIGIVTVTNASAIGGGVQYTEGDTDTTITGTAVMWEDTGDTLVATSAGSPLPVSVFGVNEEIAVQPGAGLTGGGTEAAALRVTVANDSTGVLSVDDNGSSLTIDGNVGVLGNITLSDPKGFIGLTTVNIGSSNTVVLGNGVGNVGFATVSISNPTLYAVVNTGAVGVTNSIVTVANTPLSTQIIGNVTISDSKGFIGLVTAVSNAVDFVSTNNSTTTPLGISGNFTGTGDDCLGYQSVTVTLASDKNSTASGMKFQFSTDNTNWDDDVAGGFDFIANTTRRFQFPISARYFRVNYTNTNSAQTFFRVQTILHRTAVDTTIHRLDADVKIDRSATLVKAGIVAQINGTGDFTPIQANSAGVLKVGGTVSVDSLVGNVTLSDAKTYVGLTTTTLGVGTQFIGLTTVVQSSSVRSIVGNLTLSDSKGFIGLVTVVGSLSPAAGNVTLDAGSKTQIVGNVTISDSKSFIGLVTVGGGILNTITAVTDITNPVAIKGNITLSDPKGFIGLVTIVGSLSPAAGNVTLDSGSLTGLVAGVNSIGFATVQVASIAAGANYIGLASVNVGGTVAVTQSGTWDEVGINDSGNSITIDGNVGVLGNITLSDSKTYIGLVTVDIGASKAITWAGNVTLDDGSLTGIVGNVTLSDSKTYIGLVTVTQASSARTITGNLTLSDAKTYVGLVTATNGIGTQFIGLVTANTINTGTNKTLVILPVGLGQNSLSTVAVPTNAQRIKVTSLILNSNITTDIALKSGVTYLTGNASLGITIFPGGGFVLPGSPDSPQWISLPSGALVVEKRDSGGTTSKVAGHAIYFDET